MAKFKGKDLYLNNDDQIYFGDNQEAAMWYDDDGELHLNHTISGIDPTNDYHLTTKNYVDNSITNISGSTSELEQIHVDSKEPTGFVNRTDSTISWDDSTRTMTIGGTFDYYIKGVKYTITGPKTKSITDTEGMWYFYFDNTSTLQVTQNVSESLFTQNALCTFVYWDADNNKAIYHADERHGITMDGSTHYYLHTVFGCQYASGLALGDMTVDGDGNVDSSAQFSISDGVVFDEDIRIDIDDDDPQNLSPIAYLPIYYLDGATHWRKDTATAFPVKRYGTGRLAYNKSTAGTWSQAEVTNSDFVLCHIFATNDINNPMIAVQGQTVYTTVGKAREGAGDEIHNIVFGGVPFAEITAIATVIYQTRSSYSNTVKARVRSTDTGDDYVDFRGSHAGGTGTTTNDHGNLSGLGDDDHLQYILVDGTRGFTGTVSGVSPVLDNDLVTKSYVDTTSSSEAEIVELTTTVSGYYKSGADIIWNSEIVKDSIYTHTTSGTSITTLSGGYYEVNYKLNWLNDTNNSLNISTEVEVNNTTTISYSKSHAYSPGVTFKNLCNHASFIYEFDANDYFEVKLSADDSASSSGWYNSSWSYRKKITIDNTKVSGSSDLTNFPVLIDHTDVDLKDTTNGGHVGKSNGGDILFTSSNGTTKLKHELQEYVNTTGEIIAWVKIPTLDYNDDTEIYMYYGYTSASNQEDASNVWSNGYEGVWHFEETTGDYTDSTGNGNDSNTVSNLVTRSGTGIIGLAPEFGDDTSQNIKFDVTTLDTDVDNMTFEGWAKLDDLGSGRTLFSIYYGNSDRAYLMYKDWDTPYGFDIYNNIDSTNEHIGENITRSTNTWYHVAWTIDGTNWKIFVNGTQTASKSQTLQISDISTPRQWGIGIREGESSFPFDGIIDEVRISSVARSAAWLATQYNNQNSPATFYSVESEEEENLKALLLSEESVVNCKLLRYS